MTKGTIRVASVVTITKQPQTQFCQEVAERTRSYSFNHSVIFDQPTAGGSGKVTVVEMWVLK